jgi:hypothetical protein
MLEALQRASLIIGEIRETHFWWSLKILSISLDCSVCSPFPW